MEPMKRISSVALAALLLAASPAPPPASADWPELGRAICLAPADQNRPQIVSDGAAGAIIVWQDARSARINLFARRVLASGEPDPAWPADGRPLLADSAALGAAGQQAPVVVSDGAGGAIVAWREQRSASGFDIFAQRILASGVVDPAWPANGRALCSAAGAQEAPAIAPDGLGGAIVAWMDARSEATGFDVFAQHVLASGVVDPAWPLDGVAVSSAAAEQAFPRIVSDDAGGAIVTWFDFRPGTSGIDLYAQRVRGSGTVDPAWPVDGRALTLARGAQEGPAIVADGQNGAIIAWTDSRDGFGDIYAQRVLGSGAIAAGWPADGQAICTAADEQIDPVIASDGAGGAIVAWRDSRGGLFHNPFVQHVLASGSIDATWPDQGRRLSSSTAEQSSGAIVEDGNGGAIVTWMEDFFIYAHRVESTGILDSTFPSSGRLLRNRLSFQLDPVIVAAGQATAIVAWTDLESSQDSNIFANQVVTSGTVGVEPGSVGPEISFARPSPNPARLALTLRFALPRETRVRLAVYDAAGRRVRDLVSGVLPAGGHAIGWNLLDERGRAVGAGLYFVRLEAEGRSLVQRVAALE